MHHIEELAQGLPAAGNLAAIIAATLFSGLIGVLAGGVLVGASNIATRLVPGREDQSEE